MQDFNTFVIRGKARPRGEDDDGHGGERYQGENADGSTFQEYLSFDNQMPAPGTLPCSDRPVSSALVAEDAGNPPPRVQRKQLTAAGIAGGGFFCLTP